MKIANAMLGGLVLAATPFLATAADNDMSYRYFQVGYMETEVDIPGANETLDGFGTRGSFGFAENFFVFTEFSSQEIEEGNAELELNQMAIGLGGHYPLTDTIDLVGRVGAAEADLEVTAGDVTVLDLDESGYIAGAGLRAQAGDNVQLEFGVIHQDIGEFSDTGFEVAARYHFNRNWAVALEYQDIGDFSNVFAGVRYSFAKK